MLKVRIIPILTFNGWSLVKTKQFSQPRIIGNPVQAAKVYNSRNVDELIFLDIYASKENRGLNLKVVKEVINQCFMPVGIGGGIKTIEDINSLLRIGADKVVIKNQALLNPNFIKEAADFFGSQCISIAVDVYGNSELGYTVVQPNGTNLDAFDFIESMEAMGAGEIILTAVEKEGMMAGFDVHLLNKVQSITRLPIVLVGGGGTLDHYDDLFSNSPCDAVGSASIFHFTQFTPKDIKLRLKSLGRPVRL
ncbi:MAG: imidazole glycerol phosphate synthase subunit HisF [Bacteroidetes bacterium]|nr:imidazole glycerol phosphate synthase subunit HisF [Bacteroidota bacterium]